MQPCPRPFATARRAVLAGVLAGTAGACLAQATPPPPEVQWLVYELPPLYITQGPRQGQGVLDRLLREVLIPRLPGLKHQIVALPPKRLEASLQQLPNACVLGMLKNADRETYLHFSRPFPINAAPALMVRRADAERWRGLLDAQGRLSLKAWLQRPETRFGLAEGRAYGATLDALLDAQPDGRVSKVTSKNPTLNLMQMLQRGRIDGLLVLPFEPRQLAAEATLDLAEVQVLPLQEQGPTREGHVACARSPLGAQVVKQAEDVLISDAFSQGIKARSTGASPR